MRRIPFFSRQLSNLGFREGANAHGSAGRQAELDAELIRRTLQESTAEFPLALALGD